MKISTLTFFLCLFSSLLFAQSKYNLQFEQIDHLTAKPDDWDLTFSYGGHKDMQPQSIQQNSNKENTA
jgi:hypothetical protein